MTDTAASPVHPHTCCMVEHDAAMADTQDLVQEALIGELCHERGHEVNAAVNEDADVNGWVLLKRGGLLHTHTLQHVAHDGGSRALVTMDGFMLLCDLSVSPIVLTMVLGCY